MPYVIFTRVNGMAGKGRLVLISKGREEDEDDVPAEYGTYFEAQEVAEEVPACMAWGYDIVEVGA